MNSILNFVYLKGRSKSFEHFMGTNIECAGNYTDSESITMLFIFISTSLTKRMKPK